MDLRRLRLAISQIGVKASQHLPEPRGMLIALEDLPPEWKVLDERRWRSGSGEEPWAIRVRKLGGLTAWRSFQAASNDRWLWVQATPLASDEDAEAARAEFWRRTLKNLAAQVRVTATQDGPPLVIGGSSTTTVEQHTMGPAGPGAARYMVWSHGSIVSAISASASGEPWPWTSLEGLAKKQNERIDAVVVK
jgi:hypothetical protein